MFIATFIFKTPERAAWLKTPYQITKQYELWKELTGRDTAAADGVQQTAGIERPDAIDIALGGL